MRQFVSGILTCMICGVLGVGLAAILFFPNILYVLGNTRSQNKLHLENLAYSSSGLLHIIKGFLFPGEPMRELSAIMQQNWRSTSAYLPFFGTSMVIAYLKGEKKTWLYRLLLILGVISLFPLSNSLFTMFSEAYQRWWYMFVLIMALATIKVLEHSKEYPVIKSSLLYVGTLTIFYFAVRFVKWNSNGDSIVYKPERFTLFYLIALIGPTMLVFFKMSYKTALMLTMCGCIVTTGITLHFYRSANNNLEEYRENFEAGLQLKTIDDQYRYNSVNNEMMINGEASGIGVFCTTVENSSRKFDDLFGNYSTNSTEKRYDVPGLPELLGGKFEISKESGDKEIVDSVRGRDATFYITEKRACPIGFAVDYMLTEKEFTSLPQEKKALTLMQAAIVDESKLDELEKIVTYVADGSLDYESNTDSLVERTIANKVNNFQRDSHGFKCTISYAKNRLLYFTVPWSEGWKATIDGEDAEVLESGGMMALIVPAGEHQIEFSYHTPGFRMGILVSGISLFIFLLFIVINVKIKEKGVSK